MSYMQDVVGELFKKGRMDVLLLILKKREARFSDVRKFCLKNKIVRSRGTVSTIMRNLTDMNLLEREVLSTRPVKTIYRLTELGNRIAEHLEAVKELLKEGIRQTGRAGSG